MKTAFLDLATITGFCVGDETRVEEHGSFRLPSTGSDIGAFLHAYRQWLVFGVNRWKPNEIVFESPILPGTTNLHTCRKLYGLTGFTELIARDHAIPCREANLTDIRGHFIGVPRAPKHVKCGPACKRKRCGHCKAARRKWIKETTITACRNLGFRPDDDNDADALAGFSFVLSTRVRGFVLAGTELAVAA